MGIGRRPVVYPPDPCAHPEVLLPTEPPQVVSVPAEPVRALWVIVAINLAVFLAWQVAILRGGSAEQFMSDQFVVSWSAIAEGRIWTLLTSEFSHVGLLHISLNMIALTSLGIDLERVLGWRA